MKVASCAGRSTESSDTEADTGSSDTGEEVGSSGSCSEAAEGWTLAPPPAQPASCTRAASNSSTAVSLRSFMIISTFAFF